MRLLTVYYHYYNQFMLKVDRSANKSAGHKNIMLRVITQNLKLYVFRKSVILLITTLLFILDKNHFYDK